MAKRRIKTFTRRAFGRAKKSYKKSGSMRGLLQTLAIAGAYTYVAPMIQAKTDGFTSKIPSAYHRQIAYGGAGGLAAWKGRGVFKTVGQAVFIVELVKAIQQLSSGQAIGQSSTGSFYL